MPYSRILLVRMSSLGDVVMTLPCLALLRKCFPSAHITWLVNKGILPLLEGNPYLNETIPFDRRTVTHLKNWVNFFKLGGYLQSKNYDLAIDSQGLLRSAFLAYATHAPIRVGFSDNREGSAMFYTHRVLIPKHIQHAVDRYLYLMRGIPGITLPDTIPIEYPFRDLSVAKDSLYQKLTGLGWKENNPFVIVTPSTRWETKKWIPERFAELSDKIINTFNYSVVFIGGMEDQSLGLQVASKMKNKPVSLIGNTSMIELALLLKLSKLVIANDTGPMHLAVALGTPVVAIFGPTHPGYTGPYGTKHTVVRVDVPCGPCFLKICPGYGHVCMKDISTEMVYNAAIPYLK